MIKKILRNRYFWTGVAIVVISVITRFYQLGVVPGGLDWDEAAIGYNGYAVLTTGRDELTRLLPISFKSFGDFKSPLAIYLNGPFTYIFGFNALAVRLPFAIFGVLAVLGMMLLFRELWLPSKRASQVGLVAGALLALSPWHLQFSRIGFESGIALSLLVWGVFLIAWAVRKSKFRKSVWQFLPGLLLLVLTLYTYHSAKIVTPILLVSFVVIFREKFRGILKANWASGVSVGALAFASLLPLLYDTLASGGLSRAEVTVFAKYGSSGWMTVLKIVWSNFVEHLKPAFLLFGKVDSLRHGTGKWGVLFPTTLAGVVLGLVAVAEGLKARNNRRALFFLIWIVAGILPAAISDGAPHANRSLLALPGFIGLIIVGFEYLANKLKSFNLRKYWPKIVLTDDAKNLGKEEKYLIVKSIFGILIIVHLLLFLSYTKYYYGTYAIGSGAEFQEGYLEMLASVEKYQDGVDKVIISARAGQPDIFTLFYYHPHPVRRFEFREGLLAEYEYFQSVKESDLARKNVILVSTGDDDLPLERATEVVYGRDGSVRFAVYVLKD